jgi:hypothetical protein
MKQKLSMSTLLIAGALAGGTGQAGASMQSNPDVGMGETSQQNSQRGVGQEGAGSSSVILGGPEIFLGRIKKIEHNGFSVRGDRGQSLKLEVTKDTNIVCSNGSEAKLMTGRQVIQEQTDPLISPSTEDQMKRHVGSSDCDFQAGDLVRIEASDVGTMTTITRLASNKGEHGSQIATEKDEEVNTSVQ